jgi:hypothetical protein
VSGDALGLCQALPNLVAQPLRSPTKYRRTPSRLS